MKKSLLFVIYVIAICGSCAVEPAEIDIFDAEKDFVQPENIPSSFIATLDPADSETRSSYDSEGKFNWTVNDEVCLLYWDATNKRQACIRYYASELNNEGKYAVFSLSDGQEETITAISSYTNTGIAFYPSSMARPKSTEGNTLYSEYGAPFVTVQGTHSGNSSEVVLLGKSATTDGSNMVVNFKTAMSVLKFTLSSIPSAATKLELRTADPDKYLWGDFVLDLTAPAPLEIARNDYKKYSDNTYHTGSYAVSINRDSSWDSGSRSFYFNIPVGEYDGRTLKLRLLDASGNVLLHKDVKADYTFVRNDMICPASITCPSVSTVTVNSYASAPVLHTTNGSGVSKVFVHVSTSPISEDDNPEDIWKSGNCFSSSANYTITNLTPKSGSFFSTSGRYYLHYIASSNGSLPKSLTDQSVFNYGSIPFYYINDTDKAARVGQYVYASGTVAPTALDNKKEEVTVSLAVSNDASKGNMMITEFCGYSYKTQYSTATSSVTTQGTSGSPVYGEFSASTTLNGYPAVIFSNTLSQLFFKDNSGYNYYLGEYNYPNQVRFAFGYNSHDLTCWGSSLRMYYYDTNHDKVALGSFAADYSLINKCTISSNSEQDDDKAIKMVDGDPESYWHSIWSGTHQFDTTYGVYFTIQLPDSNPLKTFQLKYRIRPSNNNGTPRAFKYWISSDGTTWTKLEDEPTNDVTTAGALIALPEVTAPASFTYLRVGIVKAGNGTEGEELTATSGSTAIADLFLSGNND